MKKAPYLRGNPVFGSAREMRRDPLRMLTETRQRHGDFVRFRLGPYRVHLLSHPDCIAHILQKNPRNYLKDGYEHIEIVGNGLLASEGDFWRRRRRIVQPAFHRERLRNMVRTMTDATENMLERWRFHGANGGGPLDIDAEMSRLTLEIVGRTLFGVDLTGAYGEVGKALQTVLTLGFQRTGRFLPVPTSIPTPANRRYRAAVEKLNNVVDGLIARRQQRGGTRRDLLSMLLEARDEGRVDLGPRQLRDEAMTVLTAGYETTARALTWTWYLLDSHPEARARLEDELDLVPGRRIPAYEDLEKLSYTEMVFKESLRLLPPVWGLSRLVAEEDEVWGYRLPKGSRVVISQYVTHRHPEFWEAPEEFEPERFGPDRGAGRPKYAYFPFSGGPRQCIGTNFAAMEAKLILATVARRYRLALAPGHPVEPEPSFTLKPRYGMLMTPEERG
ncbi:MAG: cytochrome P450 [Rubrobacteraceae bacterium]